MAVRFLKHFLNELQINETQVSSKGDVKCVQLFCCFCGRI